MTVDPSGYRIPRIGWGARLRAVREDFAHMDQRAFAESIGMNHGTYGGHEKRIANPRGARLMTATPIPTITPVVVPAPTVRTGA